MSAQPLEIRTGDPRFDPVKPVVVNGYFYMPPISRLVQDPEAAWDRYDPPEIKRPNYRRAVLIALAVAAAIILFGVTWHG